jgi:hypothetical protein
MIVEKPHKQVRKVNGIAKQEIPSCLQAQAIHKMQKVVEALKICSWPHFHIM